MTCDKADGGWAWWSKVQDYLANEAKRLLHQLPAEQVTGLELVGRMLAADLFAEVNVPRFRRAMMDGVAIQAVVDQTVVDVETVQGAVDQVTWGSQKNLWVVDSSSPGAAKRLGCLAAYPVHTGAAMPPDCDTVIPIEDLRDSAGASVALVSPGQSLQFAVGSSIRRGQHVALIGEDIGKGQQVLPAGRIIRPQDLGLLSACGIWEAPCRRRPRVLVGLTGDEVAPPGTLLGPTQIHDANGPVLEALVERDGGMALTRRYLPDDEESIARFLQDSRADVIILCGGTSAGPKDLVAKSLQQTGRLDFHGLPLRPGRPVGLGATPTAAVMLLPGNPIACQFTYDLLVRPLLQQLRGQAANWPYRSEIVRLSTAVASRLGRLDYLRVRKVGWDNPEELGVDSQDPVVSKVAPTPLRRLVQPLTSGRAANLTTVAHADGFVLVPPETEGLTHLQEVLCYWYDPCSRPPIFGSRKNLE
jgi:molybdopterin molybdotransferase